MRAKVVSDPARVVLALGAGLMAQGELPGLAGQLLKDGKSNITTNSGLSRAQAVALDSL